ncbi:ABC transporter ATPase [Flavobacteriaceae bacterium Ap0902]|nr:ABC transporter ATPase [Flavobacteriaceae bacterium Ap0902]
MISKVQSYFLDYPSESKLWVFMAERPLMAAELDVVKVYLNNFIPQWQAHGDALKAGFELIDNQFIVITVDETPAAASGCSIDSMTRIIKEIENKLGIRFTDRMLISYVEDGQLNTVKLSEFKQRVKNGEISKNATVYNNSVSNLSDFWDHWKQPIIESWAASLLP